MEVVKGALHISALKMETVRFSETLASSYESTRRQNPEKIIIIVLLTMKTTDLINVFGTEPDELMKPQ
jgi:hypothetical protein